MTPHDDSGQAGALEPVPITHHEAQRRFEARFPEGVAVLQYRVDADGALVLVHTGVPQALRGHGLADHLAHAALDYAREHHLTVVPVCPFVKTWIDRHPEFQPLVRASGSRHGTS